jgi:hypothetical protein
MPKKIHKAEFFHNQMLNQFGIYKLAKLNIYKELIQALTEADINMLKENKIFFNPIFSPASQSDLNIDLERGSKIITIDINTLKFFTSEEGVAIILHEIGHAVNSDKKNEAGEFAADDYAIERNYGNSIINSLERGKKIMPDEFICETTEKRISRIKEKTDISK